MEVEQASGHRMNQCWTNSTTHIHHTIQWLLQTTQLPKNRPESVRTYELSGKWFCWKDLKYSVCPGTIVFHKVCIFMLVYLIKNYVHTVQAPSEPTVCEKINERSDGMLEWFGPGPTWDWKLEEKQKWLGALLVACSLWGLVCQKQLSRGRTNNYIPQILWDVFTCPWHWYLLLAHPSLYEMSIHTIAPQYSPHYSGAIMGVSNQQPHDCLLNRLFRRRSKKTSKLRVTDLCVGNSPVTGEFPAQMASNA